MQTAIKINNVSLSIGHKQILTDINAEVLPGTIVGLLGPSGAGKTTLIRAILGLQKLSKGEITVLGLKAGSRQLKPKIGYVTQAPSVYADLTVQENLNYFASLLGLGKKAVEPILTMVDLRDHRDQIVSSLSGGQRARVSLAAALLGKPQLLLLDEPTVGLDPVLRQKLWAQFRVLAQSGTTILVSSHAMDEADKCDALMFMREGRLLISDTKQNVLNTTGARDMGDAFLRLAEGDDNAS